MEKTKKPFQGNFVTIPLVTIFLVAVGQIVGIGVVNVPFVLIKMAIESSKGNSVSFMTMARNLDGFSECAMLYFSSVGLWIACLLWFLIKQNRFLYSTFTTKTKGNTVPKLLIGFLIGFLMNGACILAAWLHKDITLTFVKVEPLKLILLFVAVFIQASSEELLCRGYMYQKLMRKYNKPALAIIMNGALFGVLHILNEGVTVLAVLNIIVIGIVFSLIVYYFDSLWMAMALHTAWNFSQNIIFGLPNSGMAASYSVFSLGDVPTRNSFAYHTEFGVEATLVALIIELVAALAIWGWSTYKKQ